VTRQGRPVTTLATERRVYRSQDMPTTEAAIDTGLARDLYVALGDSSDATSADARWALRVYVKPFVSWVWGGCALMALGGLLAASDRRYRARHPAMAVTSAVTANDDAGARPATPR
jgi:cytochrome c-type biogenesis protein CcmF